MRTDKQKQKERRSEKSFKKLKRRRLAGKWRRLPKK